MKARIQRRPSASSPEEQAETGDVVHVDVLVTTCISKGCKGTAHFCDACAERVAVAAAKRRMEVEERITRVRRELEWAKAHPPRPLELADQRGFVRGLERTLELLEAP